MNALACESITPLGWPVEPEVKRMYARSSASRGGKRGDGASSAMTSAQDASLGRRSRSEAWPRPWARRRSGSRRRIALDHDQAGQGTVAGPCRAESRRQLGGDDGGLDAARRQNARGANGRSRGIDRHIRRARCAECRESPSRPRDSWAARGPLDRPGRRPSGPAGSPADRRRGESSA